MSSEIEPPEKKPKFTDMNNIFIDTLEKYIESVTKSENNLQPITGEEFHNPIQLTKVYAGHIRNTKDISRTILTLNEKIPLKELSHLKRVAWQNVILCPSEVLQNMSSIQEYIEHHVTELKDVFDYFKEVDVPLKPPKIIKQYNESKKAWPCNFHPNPYLEKIVSNNFFNICEVEFHRQCMGVVFEVARWYAIHNGVILNDCNQFLQNINASVVVDPIISNIVAIAFDHRHKHPMQHSAMLAIDNVAKTQNGGVWSTESDNSIIPGVGSELISYLKKKLPEFVYLANSTLYLVQKRLKNSKNITEIEKVGPKTDVCGGESGPETKFCVQKGGNKTGVFGNGGEKGSKTELQGKGEGKDGPYLCTGYYVYMLREPCIMCSMALVHARAKRVFFCFENKEYGGLSSVAKLQTVTSLNHHFEVFTGFL